MLVAASDTDNAYTSFTGLTRLQRGQTPTGAPLDRSYTPTRSASVSAIPDPPELSAIQAKVSRSVTVGARSSGIPIPDGLSRSLSSKPAPVFYGSKFTGPPLRALTPLAETPGIVTASIQRTRTFSPDTIPFSAPALRIRNDTPETSLSPGPNHLGLRLDRPRHSADSPPDAVLRTPRAGLLVTEVLEDYYAPGKKVMPRSPTSPMGLEGGTIEAWMEGVSIEPSERGGREALLRAVGLERSGTMGTVRSLATSQYTDEGFNRIRIKVGAHGL